MYNLCITKIFAILIRVIVVIFGYMRNVIGAEREEKPVRKILLADYEKEFILKGYFLLTITNIDMQCEKHMS